MLRKGLHIFSAMPRKDKLLVILLALIFVISIGKFISGNIRFPFEMEKNLFSEGMVGHIQSLNPLFGDFNEVDRDLSQLIFSGLMRYDPLTKNFIPDLAEKWERSKDGLTYALTVRQDAFWHDETPLTIDDVVFTFRDVIQDPGFRNPILKDAFQGVTIKKNIPNIITFTLPKPNSFFISNLTVGILPKHILETAAIVNLENSAFSEHPIGSGPFKVTDLSLDEDGDQIDLDVFSEYYGIKPNIERLRFYTFPDEASLFKERAALHAIGKLPFESGKKIAEQDGRFAPYTYSLNQFTAIYLNVDSPLLKDKRIRHALSLALNKQDLVLPGEERVDGLDIAEHSKDPAFAFNMAYANKIFEALGLRMGKDGFRTNSKGEKLTMILLTYSKMSSELTEKIKNQWKILGIDVTIEIKDGEDFNNAVNQRRYSALLIRQNLGYNRDVYPLFHSSQIGGVQSREAGLNFSNFKSFRTDGLTEAIRKETSPTDKTKLLGELNKVIADEVPVIFISTPVYSYLLDKRIEPFPVQNLDFHSDRFQILPYLKFSQS